MIRKAIIAAAVILLLLEPLPAQPAGQAGPREVKAQEAAKRTLCETIETSAVTEAHKRSRLNFQVPGVVSEVLIEMGDRIEKGQALATLDDTSYRLHVEQAQASLDAATAGLEKLKAGFRPEELAQAEAGVEAARAALEKFTTGFRPEDVKTAEAGLAAAQAGFEQAERNYERMKKLYEEKKAIAEATFEQARTQYEVAKAQRDQAEQRLKTLTSGYETQDIESLKARFKQAAEQLALLQKGFRKEDVNAAKAQVALAQAMLKIAQESLNDTVLRAPYDGVVVGTHVDIGDAIAAMPGQIAVEVMDSSKLEITAPVPDIWADRVTSDALAIVSLDGGPDGLETKVVAISDAIDPANRAFRVKMLLDNADLELKAGMFARVSIVYRRISVLAVPASAILEDASGKYVLTYSDGTTAKVRVETGIASDGYTQITDGLTEGQKVIHEGNFGLSDGATVRLVEDNK